MCRRAAATAPRVLAWEAMRCRYGLSETPDQVCHHSLSFARSYASLPGFLLFIRFNKIRLTCSNSAAYRGNSEIHSLDEPGAQRSETRQKNVFPYHSGRQASAA